MEKLNLLLRGEGHLRRRRGDTREFFLRMCTPDAVMSENGKHSREKEEMASLMIPSGFIKTIHLGK